MPGARFVSIVSLLLFRNPLLRRFGVQDTAMTVERLEGEIAVPYDDIAPGAVGRAELRGAQWSARNAGTTPLSRGQRCVVVKVDGLMLFIEPEGGR